MSAKRTKPASKRPERPSRGRADMARLRVMTEAEIERTSPPELADLPADFWDGAALVLPVSKQAISLRVDEDVLDWFRSLGPRYQDRKSTRLLQSQSNLVCRLLLEKKKSITLRTATLTA